MNELKDYVDFRLTHSDKLSEAQGYPLELSDCKKHKPMRDLKTYGNSFQAGTPSLETPIEVQSVGELVTDEADANYGKYKIPVVQRGINLFSMAKVNAESKTVSGLTFTPLDDERVYVKGTATADAYYYMYAKATKNMVLKSGRYKLKPFKKSGISILFGIRYMDGTGAGNLNSLHSGVTYNNDIYIGNALIYVAKGTVMDDIIELQLVKGEEDLPYEPYVEPITTNIYLNEPLRKIGDYADYIDFKSKKIVRKNREYVILSTTSINRKSPWYLSKGWNAYEYRIAGVYEPYCNVYDTVELSTHFPATKSYNPHDIVEYSFQMGSTDIYVITTKASEETPEDFKAFLAEKETSGNPVKLYYRLKTPIEEPLDIELPKLKAKTSVIEVDTSLAPSNAYGKYIKK